MKKISVLSLFVIMVSSALAQTASISYVADVPEFNTVTLGAAVFVGGMGFAMLRKK